MRGLERSSPALSWHLRIVVDFMPDQVVCVGAKNFFLDLLTVNNSVLAASN